MAFKKMITAVDTHAGEPMRVITAGVPHIPGSSAFEKMKWLAAEGDDLRMMMLREPRGYPPVCCNLLIRETVVGPYKAVVPTLSGQAWITGFNTYVLDPSDPFLQGFRVGDIWPM